MEHLHLAMDMRQEAVYTSNSNEDGMEMSDRISQLASAIYAEFERMKIFTPANSPCWGKFFGSEKSKKSEPESGFRPKHFFQNSTIFSNNPYRCCHRGPFVHWPQGLYMKDTIEKNELSNLDFG